MMENQNPESTEKAEEVMISTYVKYCSDDARVIKGIFEDNKIRFTQPWALNDPLELNPSIKAEANRNIHRYYDYEGCTLPSEELFYRIQIVESQINNYGLLSLTKVADSLDMWSRYANGHKGFLIELKADFNQLPCMRSNGGIAYPIEKVIYVDDYSVDLDMLAEKHDGEIPFDVLRKEYFHKKTSRWKDEQEYRLIRPLKDSPDYKPMFRDTSYRDERIHLFDFPMD